MARRFVMAAGMLALAACGVDQGKIDAAQPATGEDLVAYSQDITKGVKLDKDAKLLQFFCHNTTGAACPPDIAASLGVYGFKNEGSGVDLAYAFTTMAADAKDGNKDRTSTDRDFLDAAYRVILNRAPDNDGAMSNLAFLAEGGERKTLLRAMLQSEELRMK